jgi:PEGA domain
MHVPAPRCTRTSLSAVFACLLCASTVLLSAQTQPQPKPFTKDDVVQLLKGNVPAKRVEALARERGIDFQVTPDTESEVRNASATEPLLAALRELAPKPPTLVVTTTPGGAQVFVDDELIARTSADGRLKISTLTPGPHKLRVSLDGYRDHEERVDLVAGETLGVPIPLEPNIRVTPPGASVGMYGASAASANSSTLAKTGGQPKSFTLGLEYLSAAYLLNPFSWSPPRHEGTLSVHPGRVEWTERGKGQGEDDFVAPCASLNLAGAKVHGKQLTLKVNGNYYVFKSDAGESQSVMQAIKEACSANQ